MDPEFKKRHDKAKREGRRSPVATEFMECASCRAQPGSPLLCESCIHNRSVIDSLRETANENWRPIPLSLRSPEWWHYAAPPRPSEVSSKLSSKQLLRQAILDLTAAIKHLDEKGRLL